MHGCHWEDFGWHGTVDFIQIHAFTNWIHSPFIPFLFNEWNVHCINFITCCIYIFIYFLFFLCVCLCVHSYDYQCTAVYCCAFMQCKHRSFTDVKFCLILDCLLGERAWQVKMGERAERSPSVIWWILTRCRVRTEVRIPCVADDFAWPNQMYAWIIVRPL